MKLAFFDAFALGVVADDRIVDVSSCVANIPAIHPQDLLRGVIEHWSSLRETLQATAERGAGMPLRSVRLRPPVPRPVNIDCMAVNYMEDGTLTERPPVNAFLKSPSSIVGDGDVMVLPDVPATIFEGEAELGVVIGTRGQNVAPEQAMRHVFGYLNLIDGSARGLPPATNSFYQVKSRDTFCPIGPVLTTADEIRDPQRLQVRLWNNGTLMQDFNTSDMAHSIAASISFVSTVHALEPGDIVATGTNHRGLNPFQDGDRIEMEVEGLGRLRTSVRDDLRRTWERTTRHQRSERGLAIAQLSGKYADPPARRT